MTAVRALRHEERGQVIVLVAVMLVGLVAVVGLVSDGGLVFAQRRDLQNVADGAALAGAMQLDEDVYRATGEVVLDESAAQQAATEYLAAEGGGLMYSVTARPEGVEVAVSRRASTGFLRVVGIDGVDIDASARAEPRHGVASAGP